MEYRKFKSILLEGIDCFTNDYQELKTLLEEALDDIEKEMKEDNEPEDNEPDWLPPFD